MCCERKQPLDEEIEGDEEKHLQLCLTASKPFFVTKKTFGRSKSVSLYFKETKARHIKEFNVKKLDGSESTQEQLHLEVFPSPTELIFNAEDLWRSGELTAEEITDGLWRPFPLYNVSDDQMEILICHMRSVLEKKRRVIIPCQLLSLAVLNTVDNRLQKDRMSNYFKTKYITDLSMGRRSYAARILKIKGYIREYGNVWYRTDKDFDPEDFWLEDIQ